MNSEENKDISFIKSEITYIKTELVDLNKKLFDHEKGIAVHVHDNTMFRKTAQLENTVEKANIATEYIKNAKKHLFFLWTVVISSLATMAIWLWQKSQK